MNITGNVCKGAKPDYNGSGIRIEDSPNEFIVNYKWASGISPELAVKLSGRFGNTAQFWINLQKNYELWHAEKKVKRKDIRHFFTANQATEA